MGHCSLIVNLQHGNVYAGKLARLLLAPNGGSAPKLTRAP